MSLRDQSKGDGRDEPSKPLGKVAKVMGTQEVALPGLHSKAIMEKSTHSVALLEGVTEKLGELVEDGLTHKAAIDGHADWFGGQKDPDSQCVSGSQLFLQDIHGAGVANPVSCHQTCTSEGPPTTAQALMTWTQGMNGTSVEPHLRVARPGDRCETDRKYTFGTTTRGRHPCGQAWKNQLCQGDCDGQDTSGIPVRDKQDASGVTASESIRQDTSGIPVSDSGQDASGTPESIELAENGTEQDASGITANAHTGASLSSATPKRVSEDQRSELNRLGVTTAKAMEGHSRQGGRRKTGISLTLRGGVDSSGRFGSLLDGLPGGGTTPSTDARTSLSTCYERRESNGCSKSAGVDRSSEQV
jgi:hypothetical protein